MAARVPRLDVHMDDLRRLVERTRQTPLTDEEYTTLKAAIPVRSLAWVDRSGAAQPLPASPHGYLYPRLSPDGTKVAVKTQGISNQGLWVYDLSRNTLTRLAFEGFSANPIWTPDGKRVTFAGSVRGLFNLFWIPADGSGPAERLGTSEFNQLMQAAAWSPDARQLLFVMHDQTGPNIWLLARDGAQGKPRRLFQTGFQEQYPDLSPDGRWLAYVSNESGRDEVYVQPYPGPGGRQQISIDGGATPAWSRNGKELFYLSPTGDIERVAADRMMVVDVTTGPRFSVGTPRMLFETPLASVVSQWFVKKPSAMGRSCFPIGHAGGHRTAP
jgi:Tol biopolymer transport system component